MPNKNKSNLSPKNKTYVLEKDEYTGVVVPRDNKGVILNGEQIDDLIQGLLEFKNVIGNEYLDSERNKALQARQFMKQRFLEPKHKEGYVFIYKELITNKFRIVATQDYISRIVTLQYEYPTSLEVIAKKKTTDVKILKEILTDKYQKYHSHENWFDLTKEAICYFEDEQYQEEFNGRKTMVDYSVYDSIVCDYCKKEKTNLDQDTYFICMSCQETYCNEECLVKVNHKCK